MLCVDLQRLAIARVAYARILFAAERYEAACYLAGLAVECALKARIARATAKYSWLLLGSGVVGCLTRPSLRRGRRAGLCRDGGRYARSGRNRDTTVVCPARCRGAGAARSAAATRSPRWC